MRSTLHRLNPRTNMPEVHPEVLHASTSYLTGEERLHSGIKATAESFFGIFADPVVVEKTSHSDFRIGDLMCAERPVTLYLQPPPSDGPRLMPLMRLFIGQVARTLMEDQTRDGHGREKDSMWLRSRRSRLQFMAVAVGVAGLMMVMLLGGQGDARHLTTNELQDECAALKATPRQRQQVEATRDSLEEIKRLVCQIAGDFDGSARL